MSSILNASSLNTPLLPKISKSALKQNNKSIDGETRVSFMGDFFPTEINSRNSSL